MPNGRFFLERYAVAEAAAPMRHAIGTFLEALDLSDALRIDVVTAVGEAIANVVEHAYMPLAGGHIEISAELSDETLTVHVVDRGTFAPPQTRPDRGFGLRIIRAVSHTCDVSTHAGTAITMQFRSPKAKRAGGHS